MSNKKEFIADLLVVCAQYHHAEETDREDSIKRKREMIDFFVEKWMLPEEDEEDRENAFLNKWRDCGFFIERVNRNEPYFQLHTRLLTVVSKYKVYLNCEGDPTTPPRVKPVRFAAWMPEKRDMPPIAFDAESGERLLVVKQEGNDSLEDDKKNFEELLN